MNENLRPEDWTSDPEGKGRKSLKNASKNKKLRSALNRVKKKMGTKTNDRENNHIRIPAATIRSVGSLHKNINSEHSSRDDWLWDCGSDTHVCHDLSLFISFIAKEEALRVGDTTTRIIGYGTVIIHPSSPKVQGLYFELLDVAYCPGFHTNIVSSQRMERGNVYWDSRKKLVYQHNSRVARDLCNLSRRGQLNFVTWTEKYQSSAMKRSMKPRVLSGSEEVWHRRLGHVSKHVIEHLEASSKGVTVSDLERGTHDKKTLFETPCETCNLTEIPRQISRRQMPISTRPFEKIYFDAIPFQESYNKHKWLNNILCSCTGYSMRVTSSSKRDIKSTLIYMLNFIRTQYGIQVKVIHCDNEQALGNEFVFECKENGILVEFTVPHTPEQNGPAERSGGGG